MNVLRTGRLVLVAIPLLVAMMLAASVGPAGASVQPSQSRFDDEPGRPDYELPDDYEPPTPIVSVQLSADVSDWSWPGVYDSAFRIDYTVTNTGNVRLNDFRIVEENANHIVHDCHNYNRPLAPGQSISCSALLHQSVNPQTVRSIVYSRSNWATGWVTDRTSTTYVRSLIVNTPPVLDVSVSGIGKAG